MKCEDCEGDTEDAEYGSCLACCPVIDCLVCKFDEEKRGKKK